MELELLNEQGQAASKYDAPETVFGRDYNEDLVHQIVVAYQANARRTATAVRTTCRVPSVWRRIRAVCSRASA